MRAIRVTTLAVAASMTVCVAPAAARCVHSKARTVASDGRTRVVAVRRSPTAELFYVCGRARRPVYLGKTSEVRYIGPVVVRRDVVAYAFGDELPPVSRSVAVRVRGARSGRSIHEWYGPGFGPRESTSGAVVRLRLRATGAAAFSVAWSTLDGVSSTEIWKLDRAGTALLDESRSINAYSLTLAGPTLAWVNAGQRRSATLD